MLETRGDLADDKTDAIRRGRGMVRNLLLDMGITPSAKPIDYATLKSDMYDSYLDGINGQLDASWLPARRHRRLDRQLGIP